MKRSLLVSVALHLALLAGLVWWGGLTGPPVTRISVHLGHPAATGLAPAPSLPTAASALPKASAPPDPGPGLASTPTPTPSDVGSSAAAQQGAESDATGLPGDNLAIDALTPGAAVEKPALVSYPAPVYPREARRHAWAGVVEVEIVVDEAGRGADLRVVRSSGHAVLDSAALEALRQARYEPATRNGVPESGVLDAVVRFRLD